MHSFELPSHTRTHTQLLHMVWTSTLSRRCEWWWLSLFSFFLQFFFLLLIGPALVLFVELHQNIDDNCCVLIVRIRIINQCFRLHSFVHWRCEWKFSLMHNIWCCACWLNGQHWNVYDLYLYFHCPNYLKLMNKTHVVCVQILMEFLPTLYEQFDALQCS